MDVVIELQYPYTRQYTRGILDRQTMIIRLIYDEKSDSSDIEVYDRYLESVKAGKFLSLAEYDAIVSKKPLQCSPMQAILIPRRKERIGPDLRLMLGMLIAGLFAYVWLYFKFFY